MQEHKTILQDHQEQFAGTFTLINQLISNDDLPKATEQLSSLHYADLADFLDNSSDRVCKKILPILADNLKPETLVWLSDSSKQSIVEILGVEFSAKLLNQLDIEDAIEVIENIDEELKNSIIEKFDGEKKQQILEGFNYPENTVGRIIEKDFVCFRDNLTVEQALKFIRAGSKTQDFLAAIVVDNKFRPVGSILLSTLLQSEDKLKLQDIMNKDFKVTDSYANLDELVFIFKQYALTIVPVVNKSGKLIGSVSIDNMLYIIDEQSEKDIMQLGGVQTQDTFSKPLETAVHRFPWLFVNLITACLTSIIINSFSDTIAKLVTIAAVMPIVASLGGNAGTQGMTVTIRALANKDINQANMYKVVLKEILVCGYNGLLLAFIGGMLCIFTMKNIDLGIIFAFAVIINFLLAGFFGAAIPIILDRFNIDPATASGVFLSAITDALGFFTFLILAYYFLV